MRVPRVAARADVHHPPRRNKNGPPPQRGGPVPAPSSRAVARSEDHLGKRLEPVLPQVDLGAGLQRVAAAIDPLRDRAELEAG